MIPLLTIPLPSGRTVTVDQEGARRIAAKMAEHEPASAAWHEVAMTLLDYANLDTQLTEESA